MIFNIKLRKLPSQYGEVSVMKGCQDRTSTLRSPEHLHQTRHGTQNAIDPRHLIKLEIFFSLTYSQIIAQQFRQLNVYFCHLYFMKTSHELNCCVFISRECIE